jgi:hypothetical protein
MRRKKTFTSKSNMSSPRINYNREAVTPVSGEGFYSSCPHPSLKQAYSHIFKLFGYLLLDFDCANIL